MNLKVCCAWSSQFGGDAAQRAITALSGDQLDTLTAVLNERKCGASESACAQTEPVEDAGGSDVNGAIAAVCSLCKGSQRLLTTPLHMAAEAGVSQDAVRLLLSEKGGAYPLLSARRFFDLRSPLSVAIRQGASDAAMVLLDATVNNSTIQDEVQWNLLLHEAAQSGLTNVVDTLLSLSEACDLDVPIDRVARVCGGSLTPLECALHQGHADTAKCLLAHGADPHLGRPLMFAIQSDGTCCDEELIKRLLANGNVNMALDDDDDFHMTPLLCAANLARTGVMELLLSLGAQVDERGLGGRNPLSAYLCAVRHRRKEMHAMDRVLKMVRCLAVRDTSLLSQDEIGRSALHHTLLLYRRSPHLCEILEALLVDNEKAVEAVNLTDHEGTSPLHLALSLNTRALPKGLAARVTKLLLEAGADPNSFHGAIGPPPLLTALCNDRSIHLDPDTQLELADILLQKGAHADEGDGVQTPLMAALLDNDRHDVALRAMNLLLVHGCNVNAVNKHGESVLHRCVKHFSAKNDWSLIEELLRRGANPNQPDSHGYTAMHIAAQSMSSKGLHLLLCYGANKDAQTENGDTVLHLLGRQPTSHGLDLHQDLPAAFALLVLAGCSPNVANQLGCSPLEHLTRTWIRCAELADRLLSRPLPLKDLARARVRLMLHPDRLSNVQEHLGHLLPPDMCKHLEGDWLPEREVGGLVSDEEDEEDATPFERSADRV